MGGALQEGLGRPSAEDEGGVVSSAEEALQAPKIMLQLGPDGHYPDVVSSLDGDLAELGVAIKPSLEVRGGVCFLAILPGFRVGNLGEALGGMDGAVDRFRTLFNKMLKMGTICL